MKKPYVFPLATARDCLHCGASFRPRQNDVDHGKGKYCGIRCARVRAAMSKRRSDDEQARIIRAQIRRGGPGCWEWTGRTNEGGYGCHRFQQRQALVHRVIYALDRGEIPAGMMVCHECDNPRCCRPSHLFLGTGDDNVADRDAKERQARGETSGRAKLTEAQVIEIRSDPRSGAQIAADYGVKSAIIYSIKSRTSWSHI
jgi:hypothetical protein